MSTQPAPTRQMKRAATLQLFRFTQSIVTHLDNGLDVMNPRIKNLSHDIDNLQNRIDDLPADDPWPPEFTDDFKALYGTLRRLGIAIK